MATSAATSAQIDGAYFFTPNFAVTGLISHIEEDDDLDAEWDSYGIGGEWRFAGSPASVVFGYRHVEIEDVDGDTWTIGFNFDLGTDSLQDRARSGPSFNGASALHNNLHVLPPALIAEQLKHFEPRPIGRGSFVCDEGAVRE